MFFNLFHQFSNFNILCNLNSVRILCSKSFWTVNIPLWFYYPYALVHKSFFCHFNSVYRFISLCIPSHINHNSHKSHISWMIHLSIEQLTNLTDSLWPHTKYCANKLLSIIMHKFHILTYIEIHGELTTLTWTQ